MRSSVSVKDYCWMAHADRSLLLLHKKGLRAVGRAQCTQVPLGPFFHMLTSPMPSCMLYTHSAAATVEKTHARRPKETCSASCKRLRDGRGRAKQVQEVEGQHDDNEDDDEVCAGFLTHECSRAGQASYNAEGGMPWPGQGRACCRNGPLRGCVHVCVCNFMGRMLLTDTAGL